MCSKKKFQNHISGFVADFAGFAHICKLRNYVSLDFKGIECKDDNIPKCIGSFGVARYNYDNLRLYIRCYVTKYRRYINVYTRLYLAVCEIAVYFGFEIARVYL